MKTFEVRLSDGRTVDIDAPDARTAALVGARYERQQPATAYQKARKRVAGQQADRRANLERFGGKLGVAIDDFTSQVARNTGAFDELAGGMTYLGQGGENLVRRMTGQPVEIPAAVAGRAAMDYEREERARIAKERPMINSAASIGALVTSARPTGGAMITNPLKAGAAAAVQNAPFALGRQEGTLQERLPGALKESAVVAATGGLMTAGGNALAARAAKAKAAPPSPQRKLAAEGVQLTPGQMLGGGFQRMEDAATSVPILGDAIRDARIRGIESFDRAALERVVAPVDGKMTSGVGREGVRDAGQVVSDAYNKALSGVTVVPDKALSQEFAAVAATPNLTAAQRESLDTVLSDMASRFAGPVDGQTWKLMDSDLRKAVQAADNASANQPGGQVLTEALQRLRAAHQGALERIDPNAYGAVRAADEAMANLARVREASQYAGTASRGGMFTPADLNRSVRGMDTSAGNRAYAQGDALMQDLTDAGMQVLPSTVPDSGTPFRSLMTAGGLSGGGAMLGVSPEAIAATGAGVMTGAGLYSRPVQSLLNSIYRASNPGQAQQALATLQMLAARDPALAPTFQEAAAFLGLPVERPVSVSMQDK